MNEEQIKELRARLSKALENRIADRVTILIKPSNRKPKQS